MSVLEISLERRGNYTKASDVGSERLPRCQPHHPPATVLDSAGAVKGMKHLLAHAENPKPCSEKALNGLVTGQ